VLKVNVLLGYTCNNTGLVYRDTFLKLRARLQTAQREIKVTVPCKSNIRVETVILISFIRIHDQEHIEIDVVI